MGCQYECFEYIFNMVPHLGMDSRKLGPCNSLAPDCINSGAGIHLHRMKNPVYLSLGSKSNLGQKLLPGFFAKVEVKE